MALSERQQVEKDLHDHQDGLVNSPEELHTEAPGVDGEFVTVHAVGGYVWVGTTGTSKEVKFDRDAAAVLQQKLAAAFQNVA